MLDFFADLFGYILNFIYNIVQNYGFAIVIFSILIKILMLPISIKQQKTMKKSLKIQEKMKEIQNKYKNNPEKLSQETMELYKTENMSPFSGCLSAIVQIILLFAVFFLVREPLTHMVKVNKIYPNENIVDKYTTIMRQNNLSTNSAYPEIEIINQLENIRNLKNKEQTEENIKNEEQINNEKIPLTKINDEELDSMYLNMDFFGLNLAQVPTKSTDWKAYIIPFLYVLVSVVSMKITNQRPTSKSQVAENKEEKSLTKPEEEFDPMAYMNKNMNIMFPIMYLSVALIAPLGLALYWLMNSLLIIVEKLALNKLLKDEEEK